MSVQLRNPELIRLLAADFVTRRELSTTAGNRITLTNTDLTVSGGGALTLSAAGAYTLTVPKTGTVPVGTGTAGRIAEWVTDANTVQASTLAKTGAGVLTLSAAGTYTLTVPATGTAALLGTANTFTANQTVSRDTNSLPNVLSCGNVNAGTSAGVNLNITNDVSGFGIGILSSTNTANSTFGEPGDSYFRSGASAGNLNLITANGGKSIKFFPGQAATDTPTLAAERGAVKINTTTKSGILSVEQPSTTAATPTLYLRQADLSEEFIRFDTTVGSGNPINTTALGAYYGRVRVYVEGVGAKWLALYE